MELKDKKAFITGGSSGIGLSLARSLSARGAHVFIGARRAEGLDTALLEMKRVQVSPLQRCGTVQLDVTKPDQVARAVEILISELGLPDLVINSAGVVHPGYIQDLDLDVFRWMMEVNYFGTVYTTQAFLKGMIERRSGIIVNIASLTAAQSVFGYGAYGPSKFAVRAYTDTLRIEMKPHAVQVFLVYPPDTDTPQLAYEDQYKPPETRAFGSLAPPMSPDRVAEAILKGISTGKYLIIPGREGKLLNWLARFLGSSLFPVMDLMVSKTQRARSRTRDGQD